MVEKVARALIAVAEYDLATDPDRMVQNAYGRQLHPAWQDYTEDARAAIAAMREPTAEMLRAAQVKEVDWKAMIDVALGEK